MTNGPAAIRCVYLTNGAVLTGFTLTNGATQTLGDNRHYSGGGVWCESLIAGESVTAIVSNCVLTGNSASLFGGGAHNGTLNNCTLTGNSAYFGAGVANLSTLNNCMVTDNSGDLWRRGLQRNTE